jgi:hypothetical protein
MGSWRRELSPRPRFRGLQGGTPSCNILSVGGVVTLFLPGQTPDQVSMQCMLKYGVRSLGIPGTGSTQSSAKVGIQYQGCWGITKGSGGQRIFNLFYFSTVALIQ